MPIDFPTGPTTGQVYTYLGKSWIWNGTGWDVATPSFLPPFAAGNVIINGAFDIWQRGTSFTYAGGAQNYVCDRWQGWATAAGTNLSISRQAGTANLQYAARFQRVSGNTSTASLVFAQTIETANSIPLAGQSVTLSFFARVGANFSPTPGNFTATIISGTGTDQNHTAFTSATTVVASAISLTSLWVKYQITGTVAANATQLGIRLVMVPTGTAGANDWFEITGVQLEAGTVATPFKRNAPSLQAELAACQRYFWRANLANGVGFTGFSDNTTNFLAFVQLPVSMRVPPVFSCNGALEVRRPGITSSAVTVNPSGTAAQVDLARLVATTASTQVQGQPGALTWSSGTPSIDFSAEL